MALALTLDKVHSMVEEAIAEKGADYIYPNFGPSCTYVDHESGYDKHGEPTRYVRRGCIVGHIFIDALKLDMLELSGMSVNGESARQFIGYLTRQGEIELPYGDERDEIMTYLSALQQSQDAGKPWGIANEMAKSGLTWNKHAQVWEEA